MSEQTKNLLGGNYNPDVLECLANLSNDEVFTPPKVVNQMLDMLPPETWNNPNLKFLDPACKTGVFLREIAKRLIVGLEEEIPNLNRRLDHIFKNQLYGIAITELTALTSRRTLYCSKYANGKYSVAKGYSDNTGFQDPDGNIRFVPINHTWENGKCKYCGASASQYQRADDLETHAYEFIHTNNPEEIFGMKFDVIIGNPPYQLSDGGGNGSSAIPIYNKFVDQAKAIKPNYLSMIIPARWYAGGRGLDVFRNEMLNDLRIKVLHDFLQSSDCFSGVQIEGGVCYFLWDIKYSGKCNIITHSENDITESFRPLLEDGCDTFIRHTMQINILRKVRDKNEKPFSSIVSANDPFGFDVRQEGSYKRVKPKYSTRGFDGAVKFYYFEWQKYGLGYVKNDDIKKNRNYIDKWKVFISKAYGMGKTLPTQVINKAFVVEPNSCCTETYLSIGPFNDRNTAENVVSYMKTKFFRMLIFMIKNTQMAMKPVYKFVPMQDFSKPWTDEELYKKYNLSEEEIKFIEENIAPMEDK